MEISAAPFDPLEAAPELARRLGGILAALAAVVAARFLRRPSLAGLIIPLWRRLTHVARRFSAAMRSSGVLRVRAQRARRPVATSQLPSGRLPRGRGWLVRELGYEAVGYASQLDALLGEPAMQAALTALPGVGRVLRPVCRMLGLDRLAAPKTEKATRVRAPRKARVARRRAPVFAETRHSPVSHWMTRPSVMQRAAMQRAKKPG